MKVSCPSCSQELLLPPDVVGKMVKCPACQAVFPAGDPEKGPPSAHESIMPKKHLPPPVLDPLPPLDVVERVSRDEGLLDVSRSRRRSSGRYDDVEDRPRPRGRRGYNYDDDDDLLVRRYHRHDIREAESAVAAPAICLICYGGLYLFIGLGVAVAALNERSSDSRMAFLVIAMFILVHSGLIILGAIMMKTMRSWGFALAGGILSLITHPCNIVGIGLGVWAINVLNKKYVKRAFRRKAEGDYDDD